MSRSSSSGGELLVYFVIILVSLLLAFVGACDVDEYTGLTVPFLLRPEKF